MRTPFSCIYRELWYDEAVSDMSGIGKLVYLFILTCPTGNGLGCFRSGLAALEDDFGSEGFKEGFKEGLAKGLFEYDAKNKVVLIPKYLERNPPPNPNCVKGMSKEYAKIPDCLLKYKYYHIFKGLVEGFTEGFTEAFREAFAEPSGTYYPDLDPNLVHNQDLSFPVTNVTGYIGDLVPSLGSNRSPDPLLASSPLELDLTSETSITKSSKTSIKKSKKKKKEPGTDSSRVFQEYAKSYEEVYGIKPPTSAKNYKHCQRVIERLGIAESLEVARYYPYCKNAWHVGRRHALAQLEHDCESIYTEYVTGDKMTQTKAREVDRLAKTADGWAETIRKYGE